MENLPEWLQQFNGADLAQGAPRAALLASRDGEGWPHLAYLSAGEILARDGIISIALWAGSRTTQNILRDGRAVLHAAADQMAWEARLSLKPRAAKDGDTLAIFDGMVSESRRHAAPYADVLGMMQFRLHDEAATITRWQAQLKRLAER